MYDGNHKNPQAGSQRDRNNNSSLEPQQNELGVKSFLFSSPKTHSESTCWGRNILHYSHMYVEYIRSLPSPLRRAEGQSCSEIIFIYKSTQIDTNTTVSQKCLSHNMEIPK